MYVSPVSGKVFEDVLFLKPSYSFLTMIPEGGFQRSARQLANEKNLLDNDHKGKKSLKACKRIREVLGFLLLGAKKKVDLNKKGEIVGQYHLTLATLTLPSKQKHSDNEIKEYCLNQMLIELGQKYRVHNYIWLAEPQKNGNIHFHVTGDKFIPCRELQISWNRIINKLGYVDEFKKVHGHNNPPSVRIEAVRQVKNIEAYFSGEYTGDKSKDYNEYTDKKSKQTKHNFSNCNLHAIIGHERANLPNDASFCEQESNYAEWKHKNNNGTTPKIPFSMAYCVPDMHDYNIDGNVIDNQGKRLAEIQLNEPKSNPKDNRFYISRRPIEGRQWAAGGQCAREKGIKIVLNDRMLQAIKTATEKKKDILRPLHREDKLTGNKICFGSLLLLSIHSFLKSSIPEFSIPVKELIDRLQSPYIPPSRVRNKDDTPCKNPLSQNICFN